MLLACALLVALLLPNFIKSRPRRQQTGCKTNLKMIATALEMYSSDNSGRYPPELSRLTPNYLKMIPNCPCASRDTYSEAYRKKHNPDAFTIYCKGLNHSDEEKPAGYPQYSSYQGLIER